MNMSSMRRTPREPIAGLALTRVLKISSSFSYFLMRRKILKVLIERNMMPRIAKSSAFMAAEIVRIIRVNATIVKSKMFQLSLK